MNTAFTATLRNRDGRIVKVASEQTILEAAEAAGVVLPYGCRYGGCITCAARLVEGAVRQPGASAINARQSRAGYVLLCVAQPKSDVVLDVGVDSHGDLYRNPFAGG